MEPIPAQAAAIEFTNHYAESIFHYDIDDNVAPTNDRSFRLGSGETYRMADAIILRSRPGERIDITLDVQSLGRWTKFEIRTTFHPGGTFKIHYAWDMATARFVAGGDWL